MDPKKISTLVLAATFVSVIYVNHKFNRRTEFLRDVVMNTHDLIDSGFQMYVDDQFEQIVENFND